MAFRSMFKGTMGIGCALLAFGVFSLVGCMIMCGGCLATPAVLLAPAVDASREAARKRAAESVESESEETDAPTKVDVPAPVKQEAKEGDKAEAMVMATQFVKKFLKHPDDADFEWHKDSGLTQPIDGQQHWVISGKVKAANDFGAKLTHTYKAQLYYKGNKTWVPRAIEIDGKQVYYESKIELPILNPAPVETKENPESESESEPEPEPEPESNIRTWTGKNGKTMEAEFIKFGNGIVHLRTAEGKDIKTSIDKLSEEDQQYVRKFRRK